MAADGQITNEKGDPLDLPTVINSTPGLIHTSQPDGYLDFFNQTWLSYVGKPLELLRFFGVPRLLLGAHLRDFRRWVRLGVACAFFRETRNEKLETAYRPPSSALVRCMSPLDLTPGRSHIQLPQVFRRQFQIHQNHQILQDLLHFITSSSKGESRCRFVS